MKIFFSFAGVNILIIWIDTFEEHLNILEYFENNTVLSKFKNVKIINCNELHW